MKYIGGKIVEGITKEDKVSIIYLGDLMVDELNACRESKGNPTSGLIYTNENGGPANPKSFTRHFTEVVARHAGVDITLHGLRHTEISILLDKGVPLSTVSKRSSHATAAFTADKYGHALPHGQEEAAAVMDDIIRRHREKRQT